MNEEQNENDIEARERTPEDATRKLLKLVNDSPTFEAFKERLQSFTRFYLGDPMPEPFRTWGWAQFQQFYLENKKA